MEILIVEDDFISRSLLKNMLMEMGHTVVDAEDGQQGWRIIKTQNIRIVISDWVMPGMNGLDLCAKIRSGGFQTYVYIIILTAKDHKADLVNVFNAGADDYIPKPVDPEELRARIMAGIRMVNLEEHHKTVGKRMTEDRDQLRRVIDSLRDEIVTLDRDLNIISANKAFFHNSKLDPEDLAGKHCSPEVFGGNRFLRDKGVLSLVKKVFDSGEELTELLTDEANNHLLSKQVSCAPIRDESNNVVQVVLVGRDVDRGQRENEENHSLNEKLIETKDKLQAQNAELKNTLKRLEITQAQMLQSEKMASIGQLAAGIAHEINNPTGFVSANLKTLQDYQKDFVELMQQYHDLIAELETDEHRDKLSGRAKEALKEIKVMESDIDLGFLMEDIVDLINDCREGASRIKKIVSDLKDFAHPGDDCVQDIDINNGLESTLNVVNNELKYKATVHREFGEIPMIKGYPQQLNQVFMNILVNAAQAIPHKGEIQVKTRQSDEYVEIRISDTGCGIPQENLPKIFEPFFTTKDVGKGTGLGMNIAYNIVKKHNGSIEVSSEEGKGTTFTVKLPIEAVEGDAVSS